MAKQRRTSRTARTKPADNPAVVGLHSEVTNQPITETLESNYMPYAMSTNVSRAFPEIDGFKPSHRKLLYTMYKMGLLTGARQKSANIVGQTMKLNPHGDAAIYETMVRLATGNEALLTPFVDSKGNFGKFYSGDLSYAASRYTEAKLSPICAEIFKDIDKDPVDFVDSYDGSMKEPRLLPTVFPNVLVSANKGIGVAMASDICGFNFNEVCLTTMNFIKDPDCDLLETMPAPDFSTGGDILYNKAEMERIYATGLGSFQIRSRWRYVAKERIIEVYEIPYTTKTDVIIDRIIALSKAGKLREVADVRDETDLSGLRIAIEIKRGVDPDVLMRKLFKMTSLQDSFACNFNVLVDGYPKVMGVRQILSEWLNWRITSTRRRLNFDLGKQSEKLHLLEGLEAILLDIDKAIEIIRHTKQESQVVPNLMIGFGIDREQAEYVANIRLRNINEEYILKRVAEIAEIKESINKLTMLLATDERIKTVIYDELAEVNESYVIPRKTGLIEPQEEAELAQEEAVEEYPVMIGLSRQGYLKKIATKYLSQNGDHKFKEGDGPFIQFKSLNSRELLVFTTLNQVYKCKINDFENMKASQLGVFLPTVLQMEPGEDVTYVVDPGDYNGCLLVFFENGRVARISLKAYQTKTNRKKLKNAIYGGSKIVYATTFKGEIDVACWTSDDRLVVFNSALLRTKTTNNTQGVQALTPRKGRVVLAAGRIEGLGYQLNQGDAAELGDLLQADAALKEAGTRNDVPQKQEAALSGDTPSSLAGYLGDNVDFAAYKVSGLPTSGSSLKEEDQKSLWDFME